MQLIPSKIRKSLAIRGYLGTIKLCGSKAILLFGRLSPSYRAARKRERDSDLEFDRQYGVETSGTFHPEESAVQGENWLYGIKYQAVSPVRFNQAIKELCIPYEEFVFVDFGSGKGRAVLLAAGFPFKRIVGVEYCEDLHRTAGLNLLRYPNVSKICKDICLLCMDASEYCLPNQPLVLYFYNPFGRAVMEKVVENVRNSYQLHRKRIVVVNMTAFDADLWDEVCFLKRSCPDRYVWDTNSVSVGL